MKDFIVRLAKNKKFIACLLGIRFFVLIAWIACFLFGYISVKTVCILGLGYCSINVVYAFFMAIANKPDKVIVQNKLSFILLSYQRLVLQIIVLFSAAPVIFLDAAISSNKILSYVLCFIYAIFCVFISGRISNHFENKLVK